MPEKELISIRQFTILVTLITIGDAILVLPALVANEAKQDAWLSAILSLFLGLLIVYLMIMIGSLFPEQTLIEYNAKILGKWIGSFVSLLFLGYLLLSASAHVRELGDFITTHILSETPIEAIHLLFISIIIIGVRLGLETIARAAELLFPWFTILFISFILFLLKDIEFAKLQPILVEGIKPILRGSITATAFPFMELVAFLMIFPNINKPNQIKRGFLIGALLGGIALTLIITLCILVLGAGITIRHIYPTYTLAKFIQIDSFIQRAEGILAIMWIITVYIKITFYFYVLHIGLAQLFKLKEYRVLSFPLGMILYALALLISPNISYFNLVISKYWPFYDSTFSVLLPLLLLGVYTIRKKIKYFS